jgi:dipeptidyl-peptidase-3
MTIMSFNACNNATRSTATDGDDFNYFVDQFEDMRVLKYKLPGFDSLTLQQKKYIYYLGEAALCGRDILWDQNFKYNLH